MVPPSDGAARAVQRALRLTARRARTEAELRKALARDFQPDVVDAAVERMRALGYVDDPVWAAAYVARPRSQERAASLLRRELRARGVSDGDADAALVEHDDGAAALRTARKRLRALRSLAPERRERRLRDHLLRRGFARALAESVAVRALSAELPIAV